MTDHDTFAALTQVLKGADGADVCDTHGGAAA
jgi:hypothetical protein